MPSVRNGNSEGKTLPFEIGQHFSPKKKKKNENLTFLNENQQYVYHHEIEEECREFYFCLTVFSRVTSST